MKITIPHEFLDLNKYIKVLNYNRFEGNAVKRNETKIAALYAGNYKRLLDGLEFPVEIVFTWHLKDRRKDLDNVAFAKKFVLDGLVAAGILPNDSMKYVSGFRDLFVVDVEGPRVDIEMV